LEKVTSIKFNGGKATLGSFMDIAEYFGTGNYRKHGDA